MIEAHEPSAYARCIACYTQKNLKYFILGTKVKDGLTICNDCLKELSKYKDEEDDD